MREIDLLIRDLQYNSPKISALAKQVSAGSANLIDLFWQDVQRCGAPLIEEIEGDNENVIITFLYKGDTNIKNILIYGAFPGFRYAENIMDRLLDTNIWYKTYIIRNNAKFKYNFSLNYEFDNDYKKIKAKSILDPFNPNEIVFAKDDEAPDSTEMINSLVVMPKSKKDIWTSYRSKIHRGQIELHRLPNLDLDSNRRIWVYTPFGYKKGSDKFNLLVLTDGFDYLNYLSAKNVLDNLMYEKTIAPTVCVLIDNSINRFEELTCNADFSNFIAQKLVPWIWDNYWVSKEANKTIIGGVSLGGLSSAYLAFKNPDIFGNVLSQSASFWWNSEWLTNEFKKSNKLPLKFYLNVGIFEDKPYDDEPVMKDAIDNMYKVLLEKGYEVKYENFYSGHDYLSWGETLANGLIELIGKI
ncbi:putative esterase [Clostridiales bacterium oral taxon 876 str. F0540]|nr:putative esterase [Clostridiales bacterium oral taxon 876 str. F0540]